MIRFSIRLLLAISMTIIVGALNTKAQTGVSINSTGAAANANAILDVSSTTKGALLPRMTSAQRTALTPTGVSGMTVFDITTQSYWYWDGITNIWKEMQSGTSTIPTLDVAYDGGGSGLGRTITADAGNVSIQGPGNLTVAANIGVGTNNPAAKLEIEFTGRGGILIDGDDTQDAFIEFENGGGSHYIFDDDDDGHALKLESATGRNIVFNTDGSNQRMTVQSDGRVRINNLADPNSAVVLSNTAGVLSKSSLTGSASDVLLGTGVFGPVSSLEDDDWYKSSTTVAPQSINDNIYTLGTVAIGANITASSPLQVQASGSGNPASNSILASNPNNNGGNDAIITARVAGSAGGDPFFSMDISGEAGWSLGVDNDHGNRFKVAPSWNNLSSNTAMTIKADGNVGIATDDADQKLQVNGVIRSRGAFMIDVDGANGAGPRIAWGTTTDVYNMMNLGSYSGMNNLETKDRDFRLGSNTATNAIYVQNVSGNVGMGTNTPYANLNVGSANGATIYLTREDPSTFTNDLLGSLLFDSTDDNSPSTTDASAGIRAYASLDHGNSNKGGYMTFFTKNNVGIAGAASERMRIAANGNVGVGNNAPAFKLHIGSASGDGLMIGNFNDQLGWNGSGSGPDLSIRFAGYRDVVGNFTGAKIAGIRTNLCCSGLSQGMELAFFTQEATASGSGDANLTERLRIGNGGNVGIGIATPLQKLHVVGNTRISGLAGSGDRMVYANSNGDLLTSASSININSLVDGSGTANYLARWTPDGNSLGNGATQDNGTDVGIGIAPGTYKLNVNGTTQSSLYYVNHGSGNVLEVGDDAWISDVNAANTVGIVGQQAASNGGLRLGSDAGAYLYSNGTSNIGIGLTAPNFKLHVNGDIHPNGFYVVQNGTDGGNSRGIRMWTQSDSNWGIYMGQSGAGRSFSGGTATAGGGFSAHAIRFRVNNSSTQGFIFENNSESNLFSLRGDNGRATFRGGVLFDCPDCGSTSTVDGNSNWGDLAIQGRVLSANANLHLSPPGGSKVIINSAYRAAGGGTGTTGLDIEDGGIRMRKSYMYFQRYRYCNCYGAGAASFGLGNWDFCAVAHVGFKNNQSTTDEDDDVQCAVYPNGAGYGEQTNYDYYYTEQYNTKRYWYMYFEAFEDTNGVTCAASCMNFE